MEVLHNGRDLHAGVELPVNPCGFDAMEEEQDVGVGGRGIWLEKDQDNLLDGNDPASIFYNDFPPLPDFPCMSSSSSSSSAPAPAKPIAPSCTSSTASSSSSSAASWSVLKYDASADADRKNRCNHRFDQDHTPPPALSSTDSMEAIPDGGGDADCMDVMETFGYMDLIDSNDIWDPSCIFQNENPQEFQQDQKDLLPKTPPEHQHQQPPCRTDNEERPVDELGVMFFEWLKTNKDYVSAEDMRSIKLKRATIECASKRLGSTKEGRKQLLKLILEWVEKNQLQKKKMKEFHPAQYQDPFQNPNPNFNPLPPDPTPCFSPTSWIQSQLPYAADPNVVMPPPPPPQPAYPPVLVGYGGDPYSNGLQYPPPPPEYHVLEGTQSWGPSQFVMGAQYTPFPDNNNNVGIPHPNGFSTGCFGNQYPYQVYDSNGERIMRLGSSATKEARKKRMARQRQVSSYHHHSRHHRHQNRHQNQANDDQNGGFGNGNFGNAVESDWASWAPSAAGSQMVTDGGTQGDRPAMQGQNNQRQVSSDKKQGWKPEKNLKFLLQKVLKQSDVGNLGRIVLPKKEAESHLPELESRDGIPIAMEDIGTSKVWNMRYRFWPNNKSRMYLLENTGEFVRANGLQEGDFIVIYSDTKCGKYLIRGVKVRQMGPKTEGRKPARKNQRNNSILISAGNASCSSLPK